MLPKVRVLDQTNERRQQTPWMRSVYNQSFQKYTRDLLFQCLWLCEEQMEQKCAKVISVVVGIPQVICNGIEQQVSTLAW